MVAQTLQNWAELELREDRLDEARYHLEAALPTATELRDDGLLPYIIAMLGYEARRRGDHVKARGYLVDALRMFHRINDRDQLVETLAELSLCCAAGGDQRIAAIVRGTVTVQSTLSNVVLPNQQEYNADEPALRMAMGDTAYEMAVQYGQTLSLPAMFDLATLVRGR